MAFFHFLWDAKYCTRRNKSPLLPHDGQKLAGGLNAATSVTVRCLTVNKV